MANNIVFPFANRLAKRLRPFKTKVGLGAINWLQPTLKRDPFSHVQHDSIHLPFHILFAWRLSNLAPDHGYRVPSYQLLCDPFVWLCLR